MDVAIFTRRREGGAGAGGTGAGQRRGFEARAPGERLSLADRLGETHTDRARDYPDRKRDVADRDFGGRRRGGDRPITGRGGREQNERAEFARLDAELEQREREIERLRRELDSRGQRA